MTPPPGRLNSNMYPWVVSKRQNDRVLQQRLYGEIPEDELARCLHFPCAKEPYSSLFWTTTTLLGKTPTWAGIPHSAHSIALVTDPDPVNPTSASKRFYNSTDLCFFPLDDTIYNRQITFSSSKRGPTWFLQIKEDITFPDGSADDSWIFVEWKKVDKLLEKLEVTMKTPLPPARDAISNSVSTYTSRKFSDSRLSTGYYVDVIQQPVDKGWLRMVNISQENAFPDLTMTGLVSFPWHLMNDFVQRLKTFKETEN